MPIMGATWPFSPTACRSTFVPMLMARATPISTSSFRKQSKGLMRTRAPIFRVRGLQHGGGDQLSDAPGRQRGRGSSGRWAVRYSTLSAHVLSDEGQDPYTLCWGGILHERAVPERQPVFPCESVGQGDNESLKPR